MNSAQSSFMPSASISRQPCHCRLTSMDESI